MVELLITLELAKVHLRVGVLYMWVKLRIPLYKLPELQRTICYVCR